MLLAGGWGALAYRFCDRLTNHHRTCGARVGGRERGVAQNQFSNRSLVSKPATHQVSALLLASTTPPTCMGSTALVMTHEASQSPRLLTHGVDARGATGPATGANRHRSTIPFYHFFFILFFHSTNFFTPFCVYGC
jgi:hypothetical protein